MLVVIVLVCIACVSSVHACGGWGRPLDYIHRVFSCIQSGYWLASKLHEATRVCLLQHRDYRDRLLGLVFHAVLAPHALGICWLVSASLTQNHQYTREKGAPVEELPPLDEAVDSLWRVLLTVY